ncbi:MAG: hypothetical protein IPJ04_03465 [Candidatus Eisenbacteria bacterium]|nr:hypothetical protein [Candidatus Eisenbacteria bacterium]
MSASTSNAWSPFWIELSSSSQTTPSQFTGAVVCVPSIVTNSVRVMPSSSHGPS